MGSGYSLPAVTQWYIQGGKYYGKAGYEAAAKHFAPADELVGRTVLITGANAGIGRAAAEMLARRKADVHMLCRNAERGAEAAAAITAATGNPAVQVHVVDVADPASCRAFAEAWGSKPVHALINNAGVLLPQRTATPGGVESGFATMAGGSWLLTGLLLPNLAAARPSPGRVVHVSSGGGLTVKCDVGDLQCERRKYDGTLQYAHVKRAQIMLSDWWAQRLAADCKGLVVSHVMHPGWAATPGVQTSIPDFFEKNKDTLRSSEQGADTAVWLATSSEPALAASTSSGGGGFWFDRAPAQRHFTLAGTRSSDAEVSRLLAECERVTGYKYTPPTPPPAAAAAAAAAPASS